MSAAVGVGNGATDAATTTGAALSARDLTKCFGDRIAFQDVSFEIGYGEVFGFLGPNGAGKTTTVRTLGALIAPTAGLDPVAAREVHELVEGLRDRGVTIFLTTHRLEEAERLCDRVAILNTTLRTIGPPDELRERLFGTTLTVRIGAELDAPDRVFIGLPGV